MFSLKLSKQKTNSVYSQLLLYITIAIVSTTLIVSSILYLSFEKIGLSLVHSSIKESLNQVSYSTTYVSKSVKTLAFQIYFETDIQKLMLFDSVSIQEQNSALSKLNHYETKTPFIHSVYIYNGKSQSFYSSISSGPYTKENFSDQGAVDFIDNFSQYKPFMPIPRRLFESSIMDKGYYSNVYSFIFYERPSPNAKPDKAIILNVTEGWMREIMDSLDIGKDANTFIIDNKGMIVNSVEKGKMMTDISDKDYVKELLSSNESSGYLVNNVDGTKSLITFVTSQDTGWKFVQIIPYSYVTQKIEKLKSHTFVSSFVILLLGIIMSVLLSKKLYKPYDAIDKKLKVLQYEKQSSSQTLKEELLRKLLLNNITLNVNDLKNKFDNYKIDLKFDEPFLLIVIKIDNYSDFCNKYNASDRNLLKFGVSNIATELLSQKYVNTSVDMLGDHIVLIINTPDEDYMLLEDDLNDKIRDVQVSVEKHLDIKVSVAVSNQGKLIEDIASLYSDAMNTYDYFTFKEHQCILWSKNIHVLEPATFIYPTQKENQLIDALMLRNGKEAKELYDSIILSTKDYSYSVFYNSILRLTLAINTLIDSLRQNSNIVIPCSFNNFVTELNNLETLNEINNFFYMQFDTIVEKLEERQSDKYDELLSKIADIINISFMDPTLSIDIIADKVNMSPIYLGRLYKKLCSKSISETITEIRMEKARELLKTSNLPVSEIVEKVGFSNVAYFYPLFKKMNGVTPNDYRQSSK